MLRRWYLAVPMIMLVGLLVTPAVVTGESAQKYRQENGLVPYAPPAWFLEGYFMAREKNPVYLFGPVQDFVRAVGGKTTWLIEDVELQRVEQASLEGDRSEYSLFLEAVLPESTEYWVFVVLPHESAQEWFDARRAYHGRKAEDYYGKTQGELDRAFSQGFNIKGELRFFIEKGKVSLESPEEAIMTRYRLQPVFNLSKGRRLAPTAGAK
jgi:hypothetical protein